MAADLDRAYRSKFLLTMGALLHLALFIGIAAAAPLIAQTAGPTGQGVLVTVVDENGVAVSSAHITFEQGSIRFTCDTDFAGRCRFPALKQGTYAVRVERPGYYRYASAAFAVTSAAVEIAIAHEQEIRETVDVVESPPAIDPAATSSTESLSSREILNVPYPTSREVRNALPLMPQVVQDMSGAIHIGGASVGQTLTELDGFNVTEPAAGVPLLHVNTDAVRSIQTESSRYSVEYGKGNSILAFGTRTGDDRYRFTATNFIPSVQVKKGIAFDKWVPRFTFGGPLKKGRAWFYLAPDFEYDLVLVKELPEGQDRSTLWRASNLAKTQVNVTQSNILTVQGLVNAFRNRNAGLSIFTPLETTINSNGGVWFASVHDQQYFSSGALLNVGFSASDYTFGDRPRGTVPYVLTPEFTSGSFFRRAHTRGRRYQALANGFLAPIEWQGRHEIKAGADINWVRLSRGVSRRPVSIVREDGTLARRIEFTPPVQIEEDNREISTYVQDRWSPAAGVIVEGGLRLDWDALIRETNVSPRLAASISPRETTKLSAGIGVYYGATSLELLSRAAAGQRRDFFFDPDGSTLAFDPILTSFEVPRDALRSPRFVSWSVALDQKLPHDFYLRMEFLQKNGNDIFSYRNDSALQVPLGKFVLTNDREDRYRAFEVTLRRTFKGVYPFLISYARSSATTNAVTDFQIDSPYISPQFAAPLPWDTPNRLLTWGWLPFVKGFTVGYSMELRDGYPFLVTDENQQILAERSPIRFPKFFSLAISGERRFQLLGVIVALRGTVENVTNQRNPSYVNSNVDSPQFLTFGGLDHRTFNMRIRFLGRSSKQPQSGSTQTSAPDAP